MQVYKIISLNLAEEEISQLHKIGIDVGSEISITDDNTPDQLCIITVENTRFCFKRSVIERFELEEV